MCATSDTEMKARIHGVASQMQSYTFLFCLLLSEMILRHTDKLNQTLQQPKLSSNEAHGVAMLTVKTLEGMRTDDDFDLFWKKVVKTRSRWMLMSLRCQGDASCQDDLSKEMLRLSLRCRQEMSTAECIFML